LRSSQQPRKPLVMTVWDAFRRSWSRVKPARAVNAHEFLMQAAILPLPRGNYRDSARFLRHWLGGAPTVFLNARLNAASDS